MRRPRHKRHIVQVVELQTLLPADRLLLITFCCLIRITSCSVGAHHRSKVAQVISLQALSSTSR